MDEMKIRGEISEELTNLGIEQYINELRVKLDNLHDKIIDDKIILNIEDIELLNDYPVLCKNKYYFWVGRINTEIKNPERFYITKEEPTISLVKYFNINKIFHLI